MCVFGFGSVCECVSWCSSLVSRDVFKKREGDFEGKLSRHGDEVWRRAKNLSTESRRQLKLKKIFKLRNKKL